MENAPWNPAQDTQSAAEKIDKFTGEVDSSYIKPHYQSGNLLYVDPAADLRKIALAIANDEKAFIENALAKGDLVQPCDLHMEHWEKIQARFMVTIVRPFILAQGLVQE